MVSEDSERLKLKIEMWEKVVDTQMHFNEMSAKSRQLGLTFVVAALGVAVVLLSRPEMYGFNIPGLGYIHVSSVIVLIAALGVFAVRTLDLNVYHRMLRGAVAFGEQFDDELRESGLFKVPHGMTQTISAFSRFEEVDPITLEGKGTKIPAHNKISGFYNLVIAVLIFISVGLGFSFFDYTPKALDKDARLGQQNIIDAPSLSTPSTKSE
ncbi:MAG: hypothetical protein HON65_03465 [Rhodospirillales bacterium]|jgi:hypothetical protein|nr:hypothetical protein [Rhodospirillales bacterium]